MEIFGQQFNEDVIERNPKEIGLYRSLIIGNPMPISKDGSVDWKIVREICPNLDELAGMRLLL